MALCKGATSKGFYRGFEMSSAMLSKLAKSGNGAVAASTSINSNALSTSFSYGPQLSTGPVLYNPDAVKNYAEA